MSYVTPRIPSSYTAFTDYRSIPTYYPTINTPNIPETGMLFNVSLNLSSKLPVTSTARKFYSKRTGQLVGTLNAVFYLDTIKQTLIDANPSKKGGFVALLQDGMILVADSIQDSFITGITKCATNSTTILKLCETIDNAGGLSNLEGKDLVMYIEGVGDLRVVVRQFSRGLINWYIFVALPDIEYYGPVVTYSYNTIYVVIIVLFVSLVISFILTFVVLSTLNRLAKSFGQIEKLNLDSKIIMDVLKSRPFVFEILSLQKNFKSMLFTLKSFQKYLPKQLVLEMVNSQQEAKLGLVRKQCTVFFMDVAGFTSISEVLQPEVLVDIMSKLFGECSRLIVKNNGNIDKYIGDCIMAFWGAPQHVDHQELLAIKTAVEIQQYVREFAKDLRQNNLPEVGVRVGVHSGELLVGNFGSDERLNYTVMGDTVNIASRLEGLNKHYSTLIAVSEYSYLELLKSKAEISTTLNASLDERLYSINNIVCRRMEIAKVKGKLQGLQIYEVMLEHDGFDLDLYESAYALFVAGNFSEAKKQFERVRNRIMYQDKVLDMKIDMCDKFMVTPPGDWDGSITMEIK
ncbi:Cya1 [Acrasis kona]|uniref:Cya1 n=1 Tax=Acrasis kona TaxID=1008807 RepID=A0AAW2ZE09_9EUKA